ILNPISDQMSVLRSSLIPGLLETMKKNVSQQNTTVKIFEIGKAFYATQKGSLPIETEFVSGLMTGDRLDQSWYAKKTPFDFFDLKGVMEGLLNALKIFDVRFEKADKAKLPYFETGYLAQVVSKDTVVGTLGKIDPDVLKNYGLKTDAFVFDFNLTALLGLCPDEILARILPKFPSISRDITIIVDRTVSAGAVLEKIQMLSKKEALIESVFLFDVFEGHPLAEGKKSLSFRVVYRSADKTLTEKNIKNLHVNISKIILDQFDADLPD
ncbi:MAG: phenylalanine--tRNA ligase subunit beta, partial [Proteobacteria bacterium]|nr:phenylalanine--tRNA ligase subunit beta [Pseudomonadota bacterium]